VRTFVLPYMEDKTFGVHRPITIEARLFLNGEYQTLVKGKSIIEGGPAIPISPRQSRASLKTSCALRVLTAP